jgi:hypothetical protein
MRALLFGITIITVAVVIATWVVEPTVGETPTSCLGEYYCWPTASAMDGN